MAASVFVKLTFKKSLTHLTYFMLLLSIHERFQPSRIFRDCPEVAKYNLLVPN